MRFLLGLSGVLSMGSQLEADNKPAIDASADCRSADAPGAEPSRELVYASVPFHAGEVARYTLKYGLLRVHVGYGYLRVQAPQRYEIAVQDGKGQILQKSYWHRVFEAEAYTGDWFKLIFVAHDKIRVLTRPWDQAVTHFYLDQNEEKPFVRHFQTENWTSFDHVRCKAHVRSVNHRKKKEKVEDFFLEPGSVDALSAFYKLRTYSFESGKAEEFSLYTSDKIWTLRATPLNSETVKTPIGNLKSQKIKLETYLGKQLQKKGDLFVWIAVDWPTRPIVKIEADLGFSSVYIELDQYEDGQIKSSK